MSKSFHIFGPNMVKFGFCSEINWPKVVHPRGQMDKKEPNYIEIVLSRSVCAIGE